MGLPPTIIRVKQFRFSSSEYKQAQNHSNSTGKYLTLFPFPGKCVSFLVFSQRHRSLLSSSAGSFLSPADEEPGALWSHPCPSATAILLPEPPRARTLSHLRLVRSHCFVRKEAISFSSSQDSTRTTGTRHEMRAGREVIFIKAG